ncbi:MAG TPA: VOC family protein [Bryobacteraceae bacterium]|nr:VOC family protein [Bryobacteraceae bacterium]
MRFARVLSLAILAALACAQELPITGIAGVGLLTPNLEASRQFYTTTLGFSEAFSLKNDRGQIVSAFFKVNDDQYIQVSAAPRTDYRMTYVAISTPDVQAMRKLLLKRGIFPSMPSPGADANLSFSLKDPDGTRIDFVQRVPESPQAKAVRKHLGPNRVSSRLWHAGVLTKDPGRSLTFYGDKLGFSETWRGGLAEGDLRWINLQMPGPDFIELMVSPDAPTRGDIGSMQHICLSVPDIQAAVQQLTTNGYTRKIEPRIGRSGRRTFNVTDPDGTRIEIMEPKPAR